MTPATGQYACEHDHVQDPGTRYMLTTLSFLGH